jgi:hypothetical protein
LISCRLNRAPLPQFREEDKDEIGQATASVECLEAAAEALGDSTNKEIKSVRKRVLLAAGRAAIAKAAKKRWAKVRAQAKKVTK